MLELEYHRIKILRVQLGYSLKEFASMLGITGSDMYEYETERLMPYELIKKMENMDCGKGRRVNMTWLHDGEGSMFLE